MPPSSPSGRRSLWSEPPERPRVDQILLGDNLELLPRARRRVLPAHLHRPAVQHRQGAGAQDAAGGAPDDGWRAHGLPGSPLPHRAARPVLLPRPLRGLSRVPRARAWSRPAGCWPARARSTSTSTTARPTTASCCSTRSSGASASSTRSSGPTTTGRAPSAAGRPSTTRSSSTSRTPPPTTSTREEVDREPYMAPGLVTPEKAARGKLPTDVWWHTIVPTNGREKTGYPTQKPEGIVRRMVQASTRPGDWCLDFFAGSGTLGAVAAQLGRRYVLIDSNPEAVEIMRARLAARRPAPASARRPVPAAGVPERRHTRGVRGPRAEPRHASLWRCTTSSCVSSPTTSAASTSTDARAPRDRRAVGARTWRGARRAKVEPPPGQAHDPRGSRAARSSSSPWVAAGAPPSARARTSPSGCSPPPGEAGRAAGARRRAPGRPGGGRPLTDPLALGVQIAVAARARARRLLDAWRAAAAGSPGLAPSQSLALAEQAVASRHGEARTDSPLDFAYRIPWWA